MVTDEELKEAMELNKKLAQATYSGLANDLISRGHETIVEIVPKFDRARGVPFARYASLWLRRDHRREMMDILAGVHLPHDVADYNSKMEGKLRVEIDGLPQNFLELTQAPEEQQLNDVERALSLLDPIQRELIERICINGDTTRETMRELGLSRQKFYLFLDSAKEQLKGYFAEEVLSKASKEWTGARIAPKRKPYKVKPPLVVEGWENLPLKLKAVFKSHYIDNKTQSAVARELGITRRTVCNRLNQAEGAMNPLKDVAREALELVFNDGKSIEEVGRLFNVRKRTVLNWLHAKQDLPLGVLKRLKDFLSSKDCSLSIQRIAEDLNLNRETVTRVIHAFPQEFSRCCQGRYFLAGVERKKRKNKLSARAKELREVLSQHKGGLGLMEISNLIGVKTNSVWNVLHRNGDVFSGCNGRYKLRQFFDEVAPALLASAELAQVD